ncbi:MAG: SDR family NAD(P)-dependent oxidoreductase [Alphaproteobacteria bacterium]|nr:SDR family NAD(P)-dependent oxidoreductase [Alphaproteobacteria bacterium]|tara:strand:- start:1422 stop:2156 length:735 start_codon:yes stop_codon:yes gene_type:complete
MLLHQKTAVVTGSSSGIGRAICEKLLSHGCKVIGLAREHSKFAPNNKLYFPYQIDLADLDETSSFLKKIIVDHKDINVLISNAGYGKFQSLENFSVKQIKEFLDLNLLSHILVCQAVIRHLKNKTGGDIIIMGSEAGVVGKKKSTLYSAAKFGLRGFAQALRDEVSSNDIRVCLINPGMVRSSFFDKLDFYPGENHENAIEALDVAASAIDILMMRRGTVVDEVNLSPIKKMIVFDKKKHEKSL